ncbi:MAG: amino acid ABC transporter permease [Eubacterium sp.]|jgi:polar amino acid transport system permease protein|nr:hypothetical protein CXIVA_17520 [Clostridium sp. SY8519]
MTMSFSVMMQQMGHGMITSIGIFLWTIILSMPFGLLICFGRMSKNPILRNIIKIYISIMRGTPLMLQLMVWYFGSFYLFQASLPPKILAIIVGFVLNYGAYFAEIYRSGIESIPPGQYEAARIMGYTSRQTFTKIIFPQMMKRVLPAITNEVITLVKDTSLAFAISYMELFSVAKAISAAQTSMVPFVVAAVFYYVFNYVVAFVMECIEKKMNYYH